MIFGFSAESEAWVTLDMGRNVSEVLPHGTPFINGQSESLDITSAGNRGTGIYVIDRTAKNQHGKKSTTILFVFWQHNFIGKTSTRISLEKKINKGSKTVW